MKYIKYTGILIMICIIGYFVYVFSFLINFHGDVYRNAETYIITEDSIKASEMNLQKIVDILYEFQYTYPEYRLITTNVRDGKYHNFGHEISTRIGCYRVYFYFKDIDMSISCNIERSKKNNVLIKLYAIYEGVNFVSKKGINNYKEISRKENRKIKKKFETEILDKLGVKWRHKRWLTE